MQARIRAGRRPRLPRRTESGVATVEFALVVPLLMMLFFGLISFGLAYNDNLAISNAAREGARLGAALDYHTAPSTWATSVQTRVQQVYFNGASSLPTSDICVKLIDSSYATLAGASALGSNCSADSPTLNSTALPMASGSCAVVIWVKKPATLTWLLVPSKLINLGAKSVSYYGLVAGSCTTA